jgi:hypothetical protein
LVFTQRSLLGCQIRCFREKLIPEELTGMIWILWIYADG